MSRDTTLSSSPRPVQTEARRVAVGQHIGAAFLVRFFYPYKRNELVHKGRKTRSNLRYIIKKKRSAVRQHKKSLKQRRYRFTFFHAAYESYSTVQQPLPARPGPGQNSYLLSDLSLPLLPGAWLPVQQIHPDPLLEVLYR